MYSTRSSRLDSILWGMEIQKDSSEKPQLGQRL